MSQIYMPVSRARKVITKGLKPYVDKTGIKPNHRALRLETQQTPNGQWICRVYEYGKGASPIWCSPKRDTFLGCCREVNEWMEGKT